MNIIVLFRAELFYGRIIKIKWEFSFLEFKYAVSDTGFQFKKKKRAIIEEGASS